VRRRELLGILGGAAAWPVVARAQQAMPAVGFLFAGTPAASVLSAFRKGLNELGFDEGRNVAIEYRWTEEPNRLPALAAELVNRKVAAIYTAGRPNATLAAKGATSIIPIVFTTGEDPVQAGLVASFNRPEGNLTGITFVNAQLTAKRIGLLHELLPMAERFAMLVNPDDLRATAAVTADAQNAAAAIGRNIELFTASNNREIDAAFVAIVQKRADALLIGPSPLFVARRAQLATLAVRYTLPTIHFVRDFVDSSGLMSYGSSIADANRQAGNYVGRILKGEKPGDLPVQQAAKFEFVINLQTARALGLTIPPTLLARADEVIE
jgi:putative ABC transport system substrate-binding protein